MSNVAVVNSGASSRKRRYKRRYRRYYRKTWSNPRYNTLRVKFEFLAEIHFEDGENPGPVFFYRHGRQDSPKKFWAIEDFVQASPTYGDIATVFGKYKLRGVRLDITPRLKQFNTNNVQDVPVAVGINQGVGFDPDTVTFNGLLINNNSKIVDYRNPTKLYVPLQHTRTKLFRDATNPSCDAWFVLRADGTNTRALGGEWLMKVSIYATLYNCLV